MTSGVLVMNADQIRSLQPALAALLERFRPFFARQTTFDHWHRYLVGLLAGLKRKSIEPIALAAGVPVRTATGGKIRGSPWSKWPTRRTRWHRRSGTGGHNRGVI
ncbi:MAG: hypothetical protein ABII12_05445 [Planctomycetota bacterium]